MCETHYVGMIPHGTGPLATAALVHVLGSNSPARCIMEIGEGPQSPSYFNEDMLNLKNGKLYLKSVYGIGCKV